MSKLRDAWEKYQGSIIHGFADMEAAITEAEETIARLIRERDEARAKVVVKTVVDMDMAHAIAAAIRKEPT